MSSEPGDNPWMEYIEAETKLLLEQSGADLALAMIHSRAIEHPEHYYRCGGFKADLKAHFDLKAGSTGYWGRIALRALVLLKVPIEEREKLIQAALVREEAARAASRARTKRGPGGPYKEVDLSKLEL